MPKRKLAVLAALLFILVALNLSIAGKERLLAEGRVVFLHLAPVDPRSLMQGDYMALQFEVANRIRSDAPASRRPTRLEIDDGRVAVTLDARGVASYGRLLREGETPRPGEVALHYRVRGGQVKFATNAWFFEEGQGAAYAPARYGEFRVDDRGELLLTGLRDENLQPLGAKARPR